MEGADYDVVGTFNSGRNRVRGVEFDLVGRLTGRLSAQLGLTAMQSEVLESATPANVGRMLSNFAKRSAFAQLKYEFEDAFTLGVAGKYKSRRYGGQPDTAAGVDAATGAYSQPVPSYVVFDLFGSYRFTQDVEARVNVNNVADRDYYVAVYRSGAFLYRGDARNVTLTFNYEF
jgi:catecholate siderophore receptor